MAGKSNAPAAALCVVILFSSFLPTSPAFAADQTQALINQALDKLVEFNLDKPLPEAMKEITAQTGVHIEVDPEVYDLLPWGQDTNIKATVKNQTLREALTGITQKLGLRFILTDQAIELEPMPALRRLTRRSTVDELKALDMLASLHVPENAARMPLKDLLQTIDARLQAAKPPCSIINRSSDSVVQDVQVDIPHHASLMDALEEMTEQTGATWYPWVNKIIILSKPDQIRRQLQKTISVRYNGVPLEQVLLELRQISGVKFDFEAGAIQQIPAESRAINLRLDNMTVQDALDSIKGFTGLDYEIRADGIYFSAKAANAAARDRSLIIIHLEGGMDMLMPENTLPSDVRQWLQSKRDNAVKNLQEQMKKEGYKPPSTRPTTNEAL